MNKKKKLLLLLLILKFSFLSSAIAQEKVFSNIKVSDFVIASEVKDLKPEGVSETFPSSVQKLYAFCKVSGSRSEINVAHVWYYNEKFMARVKLPIKSSSWRTYSSKKIFPKWSGHWRVDLTTEDGLLLDTARFTITKKQ